MSLLDITAGNSWQMATVIIASISVATTVIIFYKNRKIKSMSYKILTNTTLLTLAEDLQGKIKFYYLSESGKEKPIEDLSLIIIKFENDGNESIKSTDFEEPITMSFGPKCNIISGEITEVYPENLKAKLIYSGSLEKPPRIDEVNLEPLLLNPKDHITVKLLLTGYQTDEDVKFHARIVGISILKNKAMEKEKYIYDSHKIPDHLVAVIMICFAFFFSIFVPTINLIPLIAATVCAMIIIFITAFIIMKYK